MMYMHVAAVSVYVVIAGYEDAAVPLPYGILLLRLRFVSVVQLQEGCVL